MVGDAAREAALLHDLACGHVGQLHECADADLVALVLDPVEVGDGLEVDDELGVGGQQLVFERAEQVGAAGDEHGRALEARLLIRRRRVARRLLGRARLHVGEMLHRRNLQVEYVFVLALALRSRLWA